ncbi:MAG: symmetrical bis(5'-nucleosyl)-tetraphosphatase [Moraxellaceae bacterium]|nr:symmetrical bis(5'-nucleosyl)-tetraphosphatase [Moraxellaceae bacterium]
MSLYAIGDVQGCYEALQDLLNVIRFDPARDRLWFAGDLVARGPDSLAVLRLVKSLGTAAETVLGNHDLHLLAAHHGVATPKKKDRTQPILDAADRHELLDWLQHRPLLLADDTQDCVLTHAGIPPGWSLDDSRRRAREVETALQGPDAHLFFADMYGNEPARWSDDLRGTTRLRVITNSLTRMRLIEPDGTLDFLYKEDLAGIPPGFHPWYEHPNPSLRVGRVLFGHWAALGGSTGQPRFVALDTGCVWGGHLRAYRIEDGQLFASRRGCSSC